MLSGDAKTILLLLQQKTAMDGPDIEMATRLSEHAIKKAALELRQQALVTTSGAPDGNEDDGMAIDRLTITVLGQRTR